MVKPSYKIIWDRKALDHFKVILIYLEKQSQQAPGIVKSAILSRLSLIRKNPLISEVDKLKDSPNKDFRAFVVFNYRVTYQVKSDEKEIRILRVRHTSQEPIGY
ncbi:MAG: type II toxin-antitoxin system RelE/ParE family toxin [Bacteroidia bacterium]|nr:type II toxin-antitoxin system RelE/ParE family toxin [Bacteroidia bacterium]